MVKLLVLNRLIVVLLIISSLAYAKDGFDPDFDEEVEAELRYLRDKLDKTDDTLHRLEVDIAKMKAYNLEARLEYLELKAHETNAIVNAAKWIIGIVVAGGGFIGAGEYYKRHGKGG